MVPPALSFSSAAGAMNVNFGQTTPSGSTGLGGLPPNYNNNAGGIMVTVGATALINPYL
jgi:hypothetical protein